VPDAVDGLIKVAIALVRHVGTSLVVGLGLILLSIHLFDISKDVTPDDPGFYWFSRIGVPLLFASGLAAIIVHWWRSR
jgi:hypothetical protein